MAVGSIRDFGTAIAPPNPPWAEFAVAVAVRLASAQARQYRPTVAKRVPCGLGSLARRGLQAYAPIPGTVVRAADIRTLYSPQSPLPVPAVNY
jgi:hypothetical protein